ncbi:HK97 gp10 family phage protein [Ochrobactrum chromiisoli]|uniref:HK97 gp10 family phage protein n=1 Tax=Ochrobactrum chromiisoli TaxID=2993941 RepID=A0ABT3QM80_9HYPH|nr:HK97 gp10 family phage protein [Ochrobactrum chromiisoli]MCX2696717.1 HK97 gp10 family phage protein [Ochrobactrum chromiisoli]
MAIGARILGLAKLEQKFKRLPKVARDMVRSAMEQGAEDICDMMRNRVAVDDMTLYESIGWTWGKAPKGSMVIATVEASLAADWTITIYAGNKEAYYARWIEFGTQGFANKGMFPGTKNPGQGKQPFFYVSWRAKRKEVNRRIRRAITKAAKTVAAGG